MMIFWRLHVLWLLVYNWQLMVDYDVWRWWLMLDYVGWCYCLMQIFVVVVCWLTVAHWSVNKLGWFSMIGDRCSSLALLTELRVFRLMLFYVDVDYGTDVNVYAEYDFGDGLGFMIIWWCCALMIDGSCLWLVIGILRRRLTFYVYDWRWHFVSTRTRMSGYDDASGWLMAGVGAYCWCWWLMVVPDVVEWCLHVCDCVFDDFVGCWWLMCTI